VVRYAEAERVQGDARHAIRDRRRGIADRRGDTPDSVDARLVARRTGRARQVLVLELRVAVLRLEGPRRRDLVLPAGADGRAVEAEGAAIPFEAAVGIAAD